MTPAIDAYVPASDRRRVGHIVPSSNTVLEPMVVALGSGASEPISHHFTRIDVETISLAAEDLAQFSRDRMLGAARQLAHAATDVIVWNGTSGSRAGLASDRSLCAAIQRETGIPASTATLALLDAVRALGLRRYGLAVPYTDDVAQRIVDVYADEDLACTSVAHAGISDNRQMAYLEPDDIRALLRRADDPAADCLLVVCTGVAAAPLVAEMEQELGKPIIDSVAVVLWQVLRMLGLPPVLPGWGTLLAQPVGATP